MLPESPTRRITKARSLPCPGDYFQAVVICFIQFLGLLATLSLLAGFIIERDEHLVSYMGFAATITVLTSVVSFIKRRNTLCPLCRSSPLMRSQARLHERAKRLGPLSPTLSAIVSILFLQKFRCMHCATDYDLLKSPKRTMIRKEAKPHRKRIRKKRHRASSRTISHDGR